MQTTSPRRSSTNTWRSSVGSFASDRRSELGAHFPFSRRVMDLSHLGTPVGPMTRVDGGYANRLYRLDTDQGSFAVKELNVVDRRWAYRVDDVFRFEQAAYT